jgi:hypothetical protein
MSLTTKLDLSQSDLDLLLGACGWASDHLAGMRERLQDRDPEALISLDVDPEEAQAAGKRKPSF